MKMHIKLNTIAEANDYLAEIIKSLEGVKSIEDHVSNLICDSLICFTCWGKKRLLLMETIANKTHPLDSRSDFGV